MTDNGTNVTYASGAAAGTAFGSGVGGDGVAGTISMTIVNDVITNVSSFHVDAIKYTVGGTLVQYAYSTASMGGSTAGGVMTFDPTGRLGALSVYDSLYDKPWNQQPNTNVWNKFTTGAATAPMCNEANCTIHGADLTGSAGNYSGVLVSAGNFGSGWGGFTGVSIYETWKINLTRTGDATVLASPLPPAAWLFGTGLVALAGAARRRGS